MKSRLPLFTRWRSPSAVMGSTPESPQRSCGGYISDRLGDHCVCEGQRFLHNLTHKNLDLNYSRCNRKGEKNFGNFQAARPRATKCGLSNPGLP